MADKEEMIAGIVTEDEPVTADRNTIVRNVIEFNGKPISLSESVRVLDDAYFKDNNWKIVEWENIFDDSLDTKMVDRDTAVKTALPDIHRIAADNANVKNVNVILVKFSDLKMPVIPESDISQTEIPVWLVTVENIELVRRSSHIKDENEPPVTAPSVVHYVVEAYSGEIFQVLGYGIGN